MVQDENAIILFRFGEQRWIDKFIEGDMSFSCSGAFIHQAMKTGNDVQGDPLEGQISVPGSGVGCEDFTVIIASSTDFGMDVPSLEFSAEPWRLTNSLLERLDDVDFVGKYFLQTWGN